MIRGDPGRPDGWIPPAEVDDQEEDTAAGRDAAVAREPQLLLFHLEDDPYEKKNLVAEFPAITQYLLTLLDRYQAGMVEPDITDLVPDGNPANFGGVWSSGWCNASSVDHLWNI